MKKLVIDTYTNLPEIEKRKVKKITRDEEQLLLEHGAKDVISLLCGHYSPSEEFRDAVNASSYPLLSVIMPVYNSEKYLTKSLDDIFNQTFTNFELICVDDGSTDRSLEILHRYQSEHTNMKVLTQKNKYAGVARNAGLDISQGEFLLFLDSDDMFESILFECALDKIITTKSDIVIFSANVFDQKTESYSAAPWYLRYSNYKEIISKGEVQNLFQLTTGNPWNKVFRADFIKNNKLQFQNTRSANDIKFVFTALALADRIALENRILIHYRKNTGDSLQDTVKKSPLDYYYALKAIKQNLIESELYEYYKQSFINVCLRNTIDYLNKTKKVMPLLKLYHKVKSHILIEFEMIDKNKEYFYNVSDYKQLELIKSTNSINYILYRGKVREKGLIKTIIWYYGRDKK